MNKDDARGEIRSYLAMYILMKQTEFLLSFSQNQDYIVTTAPSAKFTQTLRQMGSWDGLSDFRILTNG